MLVTRSMLLLTRFQWELPKNPSLRAVNLRVHVESHGSSEVELVAENLVRETRNLLCPNIDLCPVCVEFVLLKVPRRVLNSFRVLNPIVNVLDAIFSSGNGLGVAIDGDAFMLFPAREIDLDRL